ncbi:unnamed protein product [Ilex paraguariensis]|uniref:Uncharacterized protein n=1 Tax=Ilex paraguariensis TaxID=185542 RepID=A0ABC8UXT7_9AQUA
MPEIESGWNQGRVGQWIIQSGGNSDVILPATVLEVQAEINGADEWVMSVLEDGYRKSEAIPSEQKKLQKVIQELRNNKELEGCFDPRVVSIGPFHRGKPELEDAEKLKATFAFHFFKESGRDPKEFYNKFLELVGEAKGYYLDGSTDNYDDNTFAHMMFLDGCFILRFIDVVLNQKAEGLYMFRILGQGRVSMLVSDLILLENQLPFQVIRALMSIRYKEDEGENMIHSFFEKWYGLETTSKGQGRQDEQPLHLLGLVREKFIPHKKDYAKDRNAPHKALRHSFGSATELKAKGIHFKSSGTFCLTDVSFTSSFGYGQLTLPPIVSNLASKSLFLNMIAYEMAPNTYTELEVSSYIYFMNLLISGADDVIELRSHNIISNTIFSNEGVAKFFNTMALAVIDANVFILDDVCNRIEEHFTSKAKTWMAQVLHDHFSSPWTTVAFFAAMFLIILSFTQTYFQVFPRSTN